MPPDLLGPSTTAKDLKEGDRFTYVGAFVWYTVLEDASPYEDRPGFVKVRVVRPGRDPMLTRLAEDCPVEVGFWRDVEIEGSPAMVFRSQEDREAAQEILNSWTHVIAAGREDALQLLEEAAYLTNMTPLESRAREIAATSIYDVWEGARLTDPFDPQRAEVDLHREIWDRLRGILQKEG